MTRLVAVWHRERSRHFVFTRFAIAVLILAVAAALMVYFGAHP